MIFGREYPMFRVLSIAFLIGLMPGLDSAVAQVPATAPAATAPPAGAARPPRPAPPARDPNTPGYVTAKELPDGENAPGEGRRKLHPRPDAQSRAGDDRAGRRAAGRYLQLHHGIGRQQVLSRHRARGQHLRAAGPRQPRQAAGLQPPRSVHPQGGGVCPQAVRPGHGRAVHRRAPMDRTARCSRPWTI